MPELPEVETVRRTLAERVVGKTIARVTVNLDRIVRLPEDKELFALRLKGQTIRAVERRGKFLRFLLDDWVLVSYLRMEGRYGVWPADAPVEKHTHVIFHFADGEDLRYRDVRQFGTMHLFAKGTDLANPPLSRLGLEPLSEEFTFAAFKKRLKGRSAKIKPLLLNQECIAGLGNIYTDESLFAAGIHPERTADSLKPGELKKLYSSILSTLQNAVEAGGTTVRSYVNGQGEKGWFQLQLKVYGRKNEPCPQCGRPIARSIVAGRSTHFCPSCQR